LRFKNIIAGRICLVKGKENGITKKTEISRPRPHAPRSLERRTDHDDDVSALRSEDFAAPRLWSMRLL